MPGRSQVLAPRDASEEKQQICEAGGVCDTAMPSPGWKHRRSGRGAALARPLPLETAPATRGVSSCSRRARIRTTRGRTFTRVRCSAPVRPPRSRRRAPPGAHPGSYSTILAGVLAFGIARNASSETRRDLTVAPEHRCGPYDNNRDYLYPQSGVAEHPGARAVAVERGGRSGPDPDHTGQPSPHPVAANLPNPRERASRRAVPTGRIPCA